MGESKFIPPTTKTKLRKLKTAPVDVKPIPKELLDKWGASQAIADCFALMTEGHFPQKYHQSVANCLGFLQKLLEQQTEVCILHPDHEMIQEIVEYKQAKAEKEAKNAKTKEVATPATN